MKKSDTRLFCADEKMLLAEQRRKITREVRVGP